jgi:PKD repeat protein
MRIHCNPLLVTSVVVLLIASPVAADWTVAPGGPTGISPTATAVYRGALYVGSPGGVARWDGTTWQRLYPDGGSVLRMLVVNDRLYVHTSTDVYRVDGSTWTAIGPDLDVSLRGFDVDVSTGTLYFATSSSVIERLAGGSETTIPFPSGSIVRNGLGAHAGTVVVVSTDGDLHHLSGGAWTEVVTDLSFYGYSQMSFGPRGLFLANSSDQMPIDLGTGRPTADARECYWFAEAQSSENKTEVYVSGGSSDDLPPLVFDAGGSWSEVDDPHFAPYSLLTHDGSTSYLAADDYVAVLGADGVHTEIGSSAPFPFVRQMVASGDTLVALGPDTVWLHRGAGPWRQARRDFSGSSLAPGASGDVWVNGYGSGDHPDEDILHVLADGRVEGEARPGSFFGSAQIAYCCGSLYAITADGLWRRRGPDDWVQETFWDDVVSNVPSMWGADPPVVFYSSTSEEWNIAFVIWDENYQDQAMFVEPATGYWAVLPKPPGYEYILQGTLHNAEVYALVANFDPDESAVFKWREATLDWQQLTASGLPGGFLLNDLLTTPEGLMALGMANDQAVSFGAYLFNGSRWNQEGVSSHPWGPGFGASQPSLQTVYAFGYNSGPLLRHPQADLVADFTWQPVEPRAGQAVSFSDASLGAISSRQWSFGDGGTATGQSPSHTYAAPGTYTVSLTVTGGGGSRSASSTITVAAGGGPPQASFTYSPQSPAIGEEVIFTDTSTGSPTAWQWDFGDGATASEQNPTHAFSAEGTYTVTLTASNAVGADSASATVTACCDAGEESTFYLAAVANNPGDAGTSWNTDVEINNRGATALTYEVHLLRTGQGNPSPAVAGPLPLAAGSGARHADIVETLFAAQTSGALRVVVTQPSQAPGDVLISSRTFNDAASGTFGQFIPGVLESDLVPAGREVRLIQLAETSAFRTNLGLLNGTGANLAVEVRYGLADGTVLGEETITLAPFEHRQFRAFTRATQAAVDDGVIDLQTGTAGGLFYGYASVVDNLSGDPVFVPPR